MVLDLTVFGPEAIGSTISGQWILFDSGAPNGLLSATETFELRVF